jgi:spermidine/putrescine transport system permease protein
MESWRAAPGVFWAFLLPGALWLLLLFLVPLGLVWVIAFGERAGPAEIVITWTFENYLAAFDPLYLGLFAKSLWIALIATVICLVVSFPVALAISFAPQRVKPVLLLLVILPFWTNLLIRTYAMIAVLRQNGYLNGALEYLWLGLKLLLTPLGLGALTGERFQPLELLYNNTAVVFGIVYVYLPFMVLPLYATLEKLDRSFLEASLDLGASQLRTFWSITVPLARAGIVSGVILVFIPALGTFLISDLLGGPDSQLIGNVIERQFKAANNLPLGAALSFLLLYLTFIALALRSWLGGREAAHG